MGHRGPSEVPRIGQLVSLSAPLEMALLTWHQQIDRGGPKEAKHAGLGPRPRCFLVVSGPKLDYLWCQIHATCHGLAWDPSQRLM